MGFSSSSVSSPAQGQGCRVEQSRCVLQRTFSNAGVQQDSPGEPHGRGEGQCIFLLFLTVHFEPAKWAGKQDKDLFSYPLSWFSGLSAVP